MPDRLRSKHRLERLFRRTILFLALPALAATGLMLGGSITNRLQMVLADSEEEPVPVYAVEKSSCIVTIPAFGEISGAESVLIDVPQTRSGPLTLAWLIPEGSLVEAGEPLVRFDSSDAELVLENQRNVLASINERLEMAQKVKASTAEEAQLEITSAELDYQFARKVMPEDRMIFSKWDIMEAEIDTKLAEERLSYLKQKERLQVRIADSDIRLVMIEKEQAEEEMEIANKTLSSLELVSPVSGLAIYRKDRNRNPQIGDQCWPRQVLIEVIELGKLQARLYVLERDAGGLDAGMEVEFQLDSAPTRSYRGVIESVSQLAQSIERNSPLLYFICDASIEMTPEDLEDIRPGMLLQAELIRQKYDSCLVVPESAVISKDEADLVYVEQDGTFVPRSVETAPGPQWQTVILEGVREGELIALRNPFETRKLSLPDFSKANRAESRNQLPRRRMMRERRSR